MKLALQLNNYIWDGGPCTLAERLCNRTSNRRKLYRFHGDVA